MNLHTSLAAAQTAITVSFTTANPSVAPPRKIEVALLIIAWPAFKISEAVRVDARFGNAKKIYRKVINFIDIRLLNNILKI